MKVARPSKMFFFAVSLMLFLVLSVSGVFAEITESKHDFSGAAWNATTEVCIVCHTPHAAQASANAPLWNHETTAATFTLYSSTTLNASVGTPSGRSILCLSCHDGTVALDSFGGVTGGTSYILGAGLVGTDLSNDHPVSFTYDTALATADGDLADPAVVTSGLGGTIAVDMLFDGMLECSSCHDAHNSQNIPSLLQKSNDGSLLCLTCHTK